HDPKLLQGMAHAQFAAGDAAGARQTLDRLIQENPDHKSPDGHLLYARALEAEGNVDKALEEYQVLAEYFPGAEAAVRYAQLLNKHGQGDTAKRILTEILERAQIAPAHYRKAQRDWLDLAERELKQA
ncbi:MAG: tetratricopeptide repeat protein, partial [Pseudomonadales bacterium]|nr:tetratricopeptide repeat protein [Pseudomonadales bacterium]